MKTEAIHPQVSLEKAGKITYWHKMNKAWEESGGSQKQFCKKHRLNPNALAYWRKKIHREEKATLTQKLFIPVTVKESKSVAVEMGVKISIRTPSGYILSLPVTVDGELLENIFTLLGVHNA